MEKAKIGNNGVTPPSLTGPYGTLFHVQQDLSRYFNKKSRNFSSWRKHQQK